MQRVWSMQFCSSCCLFPTHPNTGQIFRAIKAAFFICLCFQQYQLLLPLFPPSQTGLARREQWNPISTLPALTLQTKLPRSSTASYQELHNQWKSSQRAAVRSNKYVWVIRENQPNVTPFQKQLEMKQSQESRMAAKLPGVSWCISNCLNWQLLTAPS